MTKLLFEEKWKIYKDVSRIGLVNMFYFLIVLASIHDVSVKFQLGKLIFISSILFWFYIVISIIYMIIAMFRGIKNKDWDIDEYKKMTKLFEDEE